MYCSEGFRHGHRGLNLDLRPRSDPSLKKFLFGGGTTYIALRKGNFALNCFVFKKKMVFFVLTLKKSILIFLLRRIVFFEFLLCFPKVDKKH
jgi:hypothetical protein